MLDDAVAEAMPDIEVEAGISMVCVAMSIPLIDIDIVVRGRRSPVLSVFNLTGFSVTIGRAFQCEMMIRDLGVVLCIVQSSARICYEQVS